MANLKKYIFLLILLPLIFIDFQNPNNLQTLKFSTFLFAILSIIITFFFTFKKKKYILLNFLGIFIIFYLISLFPHFFLIKQQTQINITIEFFKYILFFSIFLISYNLNLTEKDLFYFFLIIFFITGCWAILQKLYIYPTAIKEFSAEIYSKYGYDRATKLISRLQSERYPSLFHLPNIYASFLVINGIIIINYLTNQKLNLNGYYYKTFFLSFIILTCLFLYLTKTISAVSALFIATILTKFLESNKSLLKNFLVFIFIICLLIFLFISIRGGIRKFYDTSIRYYISNYITSLKILKNENILCGVGIGNYGKYYAIYKNENANETIYAHNIYMHILTETGVLGFLFFLSAIFYYFKHISFKRLTIGWKLLVFYMLILNLFSIDCNIISMLVLYALLISFILKNYEI